MGFFNRLYWHFKDLDLNQAFDTLNARIKTSFDQNIGKVKISPVDKQAWFLESKLVAGTNVTLTKLDPGNNEQLRIDAAGGGGGGIFPFGGAGGDFRTAFVSPSTPGAADDGNLATAFLTIQGAVNAFPAPADAAQELRRCVVVVAGGKYDEDVALGPARRWDFVALGPVILGDGALANFASTTPRNVTWTVDQASEFGSCRPALSMIGALWGGSGESTHIDYCTGWRISGNLTVTDTGAGGGTSHELHLGSVRIDGNLVQTGAARGRCNTWLTRVKVAGIYDMPRVAHGGQLWKADQCVFDSTVHVEYMGRAELTYFGGAFTLDVGYISPVQEPAGFMQCDFAGGVNVTNAVATRMDGTTWRRWDQQAVVDVGVTGRTLIDAALASQTGYTPAAPANWVGPVPTTASAAIDRIAASVSGLLGGPIP